MPAKTKACSALQQTRHPIGNRVPAAHSWLHQSVDHECRRHVDAVLAGIFAVPFDLSVEIRDRECLGNLHAAIACNACDDVSGSGIHIGSPAMALELELLAMG